jgi:hypothetical protein
VSDEADRIRTYQELARRGQAVPGKNFGTGVTPKTKKIEPKVKTIDTTKMKQIKLLRLGGNVSKSKNPLAGLKMATNIANQESKDLAKLKKVAKKPRKVKMKRPTNLDIRNASITKPTTMGINKATIIKAEKGGLMEAIDKVKAKEMKLGGEAKPLVGGQKKLDKNKDGRISGDDFAMMEMGGKVEKYGGGGKVKGGKMSCRGMGAAIKGGGYTIS